SQLDGGATAYNLSAAFRLKGEVSVQALHRSINEIVRRHESLRTTFSIKDGRPVQVVAASRRIDISVVGLEELTEEEWAAQVQRRASDEAARPFDLSRGPLLRVSLLRRSPDEHVLLFTIH